MPAINRESSAVAIAPPVGSRRLPCASRHAPLAVILRELAPARASAPLASRERLREGRSRKNSGNLRNLRFLCLRFILRICEFYRYHGQTKRPGLALAGHHRSSSALVACLWRGPAAKREALPRDNRKGASECTRRGAPLLQFSG